MSVPLRVLIVGDSEDDMEWLLRELQRGGYDPAFARVDSAPALRAALEAQTWDVVFSDYALPQFDALAALAVIGESGLDLPLIVISGSIGEEGVVEVLRAGARDFILKDNLARLLPAIQRELQQAEAALRSAEPRFRIVAETASDAIITIDAESRILFVNRAAEALFGYTAAELLGQPLTQLMPERLRSTHLASLARYVASGQRHVDWRVIEVTGRHKDGTEISLELSLNDFVEDGRRTITGIVRDISKRSRTEAALRASEARYRTLAEAAHDSIFIISRDDRIEYLNSFAARQLGGRPEDFVGQPRTLLFPAQVADRQGRSLQQVLETGQPMYAETKTPFPGGDAWLGTWLVPLRDEAGEAQVVLGISRDITDRIQAEAALAASERRFRALIENSSDGIALIAADGTLLYDSPAITPSLGYSSQERLGRSVFDFMHPDERPSAEDLFRQFSQKPGATVSSRGRFLHKDGSWRWLEGVRSNLLADPVVQAVVVNYRDVTERMQAEAALAASERRFRALIENSGDVVALLAADGAILYKSPSVTRVLGYSSQELVGQNVLELLHPDDVQQAASLLARILQAPTLTLTAQARARHKQGAWRWIEATGANLLEEPGVQAIVVNYRDVTERQEAEERLRLQSAAMESAANAIVITDRQGDITWVNPAFTRLTGYAPEEVLEQNPRVLKSGLQEPAFYRHLWETILAGQVWQGEIVNRRKDGTLYTEEMTITPVPDERGTITHFVGIKHDITERKQAEAEILRRNEEMAAIAAVSAALRTTRTRAEMLPIILDQLLALFKADGADLSMQDPGSGETVIELACGAWAHYTGLRYPPGEGVTGHVIATGQLHVSADLHADPLVYQPALLGDLHAGACVPLSIQGQTIGALWVARQLPFADGEVRLLTAIADIAANAIHRATLHEQTEQRLERLDGLRAIDEAITASLDLRVTLNVLLDQVTTQLHVDAADVLLLNPATHTLEYAAGRGFRASAITRTRLRLGEGHAGHAALQRRVVSASNLSDAGTTYARAQLLASENFVAQHVAPLIAKGQVKGVLEIFHRAPLNPDPEWLDFLETLAGQTAIAVDNLQLFEGLQRSNLELGLAYDATIEGWSRALDLRDRETEGHTRRVAELTGRLARAVGIGEEELVHLRRGALLHDIGKMGIPDGILLKPAPLTEEEWAIMRKHPVYAYDMLHPIVYLRRALDIPYCHHERWDGTGYPRGLKGEAIPLAARIFAVVDVWDALNSDRPYRAAWQPDQVREHLRTFAGQHFDPKVVEAFLALEA